MAKGQKKSTRETRKPKQDKNKAVDARPSFANAMNHTDAAKGLK